MFQSPPLKVLPRLIVRQVDFADTGSEDSRNLSPVAGDGEAVVDLSESAVAGARSDHIEVAATDGSQAVDAVDVVSPLVHEPAVEACGNSDLSPGGSQDHCVSPADTHAIPYNTITSVADPNDVVTHLSHSLEPNDMSLEGVGSLSTTDHVFNATCNLTQQPETLNTHSMVTISKR
ncbi:hypothetical protein V6N12_020045 [Hibiscus sabdariffa]|uniref:Uncharacterized protein n=1 Tax=Hibiscus sabdariffa TaxID=183260 RepID=A0ABR2B6D7_9ROSI